MGPVEKLLREAGELVLRGRCVGVPARNERGERVAWFDDEAYTFCALGALERARLSTRASCEDTRTAHGLLRRGWGLGIADDNDLPKEWIIPDMYSEAIEAAAELGL